MLIDIHTHHRVSKADLYVKNICLGVDDLSNLSQYYSMGLHPWHLKDQDSNDNLLIQIKNFNPVFIGETGLDKLKPDFFEQVRVFTKHCELASNLNRPLIIHCVKAYAEVFKILDKIDWGVPVIFHDYQGGVNETLFLLKKNVFFSTGRSLIKKEKVQEIFKMIPIDKIFFETDDQNEYSIDEIYQLGGKLLGIEESKTLSSQRHLLTLKLQST